MSDAIFNGRDISMIPDEPIDFPNTLAAEDYILTPSGPLGSRVSVGVVDGKHVGVFPTTEAALEAVGLRMEAEKFWPSIWWMSDHGNMWPIDADGAEILNSRKSQLNTLQSPFRLYDRLPNEGNSSND